MSSLANNFTLHVDQEIKYTFNYITDTKVISFLILWMIKIKSDTAFTYLDLFGKNGPKTIKIKINKISDTKTQTIKLEFGRD